jgi:hypothetical protein
MNERDRVYEIGVATAEDIPELLALQAENQVSRGGSLSIEFPAAWYEQVARGMPIVIARRDGRLAGFLVSSSPEATRHLALVRAKFDAYPAAPDAYKSGPLCIAVGDRGQGVVAKLFAIRGRFYPAARASRSSAAITLHHGRLMPDMDFARLRSSRTQGSRILWRHTRLRVPD